MPDDGAHTACAPKVATEAAPLRKLDAQWIVTRRGVQKPIAALQIVAFLDVSAEHAIENDQHSAIVGVEILHIDRVMHTMRRRRIEYPFQPAKLRDPGRVNPELVKQIE